MNEMKIFEEIVKEKLDGYESVLPEGALADFKVRASAYAPWKKRLIPAVLIGVPALATVIAAVLYISRPERNLPEPVQVVVADAMREETGIAYDVVAETEPVAIVAVADVPAPPAAVVGQSEPLPVVEDSTADDAQVAENVVTDIVEDESAQTSPFIDHLALKSATKPRQLKIAPVIYAVSGVAGARIASSILVPFFGVRDNVHDSKPDVPAEELSGTPYHSMPLKLGLTGAIRLSNRLNLVTGLEYSAYSSKFTYSLSGERIQKAQYVGIPVMLDYTVVDGKKVDIYFGAGAMGDICRQATLSGKYIRHEGLTFSLLGAGGLQVNILKHAGLYVEPQLSWMIPGGNDRLETWRTQHPLSFSISVGIRVY